MKRIPELLSSAVILACFLIWVMMSRSPKPLLTLLAVGLHEMGHVLTALICRVPLSGFYVVAGEARLLLSGTASYTKELLICGAGPLFNLLSAAPILLAGGTVLGDDNLSFFATVSLALALLNLLPIGDLDGGRIYYCFLARLGGPHFSLAACRILSFFTVFCLWSASVYTLLRAGENLSLFFFSASLFLRLFPMDRIGGIKSIQKDSSE